MAKLADLIGTDPSLSDPAQGVEKAIWNRVLEHLQATRTESRLTTLEQQMADLLRERQGLPVALLNRLSVLLPTLRSELAAANAAPALLEELFEVYGWVCTLLVNHREDNNNVQS